MDSTGVVHEFGGRIPPTDTAAAAAATNPLAD